MYVWVRVDQVIGEKIKEKGKRKGVGLARHQEKERRKLREGNLFRKRGNGQDMEKKKGRRAKKGKRGRRKVEGDGEGSFRKEENIAIEEKGNNKRKGKRRGRNKRI